MNYQIAVRIIAFVGMWLFFNSILKLNLKHRELIITGVAICFSYLPFFIWASGPAAMPLIADATVKAWQRETGTTAIFAAFIAPLFSSFQLSGIFIIGVLVVVICAATYYRRLNIQLAR